MADFFQDPDELQKLEELSRQLGATREPEVAPERVPAEFDPNMDNQDLVKLDSSNAGYTPSEIEPSIDIPERSRSKEIIEATASDPELVRQLGILKPERSESGQPVLAPDQLAERPSEITSEPAMPERSISGKPVLTPEDLEERSVVPPKKKSKSQLAFEKGVVGSGQTSKEDFAKIKAKEDEELVIEGQMSPEKYRQIHGFDPFSQQAVAKDKKEIRKEENEIAKNSIIEPGKKYASRLEELLDEYKTLKSGKTSDEKRAKWLDAIVNVGQALAQYGADVGAVKATMASGASQRRTNLGFKDSGLLAAAKAEREKRLGRLEKGIEFEKKLAADSVKAKALEDYRNRMLGIQEASQKAQQLEREERRKERQLGEDRRQRKQNIDFNKRIYDVTKDFEKDDVVKELKKQDISFSQAENLLQAMEEGNKVALGALGTKMARAMGEVGVLTDADVVRYIQRHDIGGKIKDYFSRNFKGKLSDATLEDQRHIMNIMKLGFKNKLLPIKNKYINRAYRNFGKDMGMSREDVAYRFGEEVGIPTQSTNKKIKMTPRDKQALEWAEKNKNSTNPKESGPAREILKRWGKL